MERFGREEAAVVVGAVRFGLEAAGFEAVVFARLLLGCPAGVAVAVAFAFADAFAAADADTVARVPLLASSISSSESSMTIGSS